MVTVNMLEAKTNLSKFVSIVEKKEEPYIIITRSGKPVAKMIPYEETNNKRIGLCEGEIPKLSDLNNFNNIDIDFEGDGRLL